MKTVTINGTEYTFGPIMTGVGRKLKEQYPDRVEHNIAFIAASLKAGGNAESTPEWVDENVPYYNIFSEFLQAAFEANGFKAEIPKAGGAEPSSETAE
jgi:hypothetical protein